jgi:hypothetical protein
MTCVPNRLRNGGVLALSLAAVALAPFLDRRGIAR